jgi:hypothetical protein
MINYIPLITNISSFKGRLYVLLKLLSCLARFETKLFIAMSSLMIHLRKIAQDHYVILCLMPEQPKGKSKRLRRKGP